MAQKIKNDHFVQKISQDTTGLLFLILSWWGGFPPPCTNVADKFNNFKLKSGLCASKEIFLAQKMAVLATIHSFLFSPDRAGRRIQRYLDSILRTDLLSLFQFIVVVAQ
jgi:hypothetical protein